MLTYFCCTIKKFSPCFLLYDSLSEVFKKTYNASCSQLDKETPLSARWLRREPLLKRASCSQLDRGTGCGGNLCWSAMLSACISWGRALYFLCLPRTLFSFCHIRPLFSFCHVRPWAGHLPYRFPGQAGEWRKRKKAEEWRKRKKRGMTIRRGEPAMTGGRESTNTAGEKTSPGCVKEAERSARRRGCLV